MVVLIAILAADLLLVIKRPHVPSMRECAAWVGLYVVCALLFALALWSIGDHVHATEFVAGWLTEYSLSIDNLFVFLIIMGRFAVPEVLQQRVLMIGIIIALIFRGAFILLGAQLIEHFSWVFFIFGAFLIWTAWKQAFADDDEPHGDNLFVRLLRRRINFTNLYDEGRFRTVIDGRRTFTPMLLVLLAIGTTDVLFALDSIPAIFGITQNAFLVFATNVFALMGLRQLYFLLGGLMHRLRYLHYGIAAILGFIGVKLILHAMHTNELPFINGGHPIHWGPEISTLASLLFIVGAMAIATIASLVANRVWPKQSSSVDQ